MRRIVVGLIAALEACLSGGEPRLQKAMRDWIASVHEALRDQPPTEEERSFLVRCWNKGSILIMPLLLADDVIASHARGVGIAQVLLPTLH